MDIVLPVRPSVAMLFSLEQSKSPEKKRDFYSDSMQAISHVHKLQLETVCWVELFPPVLQGAQLIVCHKVMTLLYSHRDRIHNWVSPGTCSVGQSCWPLHSMAFQAHYSMRCDPDIGSTLDAHLGFSHSLATFKSHLLGKKARERQRKQLAVNAAALSPLT